MQNEETDGLPQSAYLEHLMVIKGVKFTLRELDIIALIMSGKPLKKMASLLSISPRTVETHTRNIMIKLECNSRAAIIDFIEKSAQFSAIKAHYSNLLIQAAFKKSLQEVVALASGKLVVCMLLCEQESERKSLFLCSLAEHLKLAGIKVIIAIKETYKSLTSFMNGVDLQKINFIIYPTPVIASSQLHSLNSDVEISLLVKKAFENNISFTALLKHPEDNLFPAELSSCMSYIIYGNNINYYSLIFEILKRLLPGIVLDKVIREFKSDYDNLSTDVDNLPSYKELNKQEAGLKNKVPVNFRLPLKTLMAPALISVVICFSGLGILNLIFETPKIIGSPPLEKLDTLAHIRPDLFVPATFLNRPEIIAQIEQSFEGDHAIQIVALVGLGGAGKTTIARQYARTQKAPLIWEITADTKENLIRSFENLAYTLCQTEQEKKALADLQKIKDHEKREEEILSFIKEKIKSYKDWLLIYDNVEKFTDIQRYFSNISDSCCKGRILLTTRNSNVKNNNQVNKVLQVGELTAQESLDLFVKIMGDGRGGLFSAEQQQEARKFLNYIPPFPLDISIAAYYLKATNATYEKYLAHAKQYNQEFISIYEDVAKEASEYKKTRYSIISLSLKKIVDKNKDFIPLLLMISMLGSQNIPRKLLDSYKKDIVVDSFIYSLKEYSLINDKLTDQNSRSVQLSPSISIHRSTQQISLDYFIKSLNLQKNDTHLQPISKVLQEYMAEAVEKEDYLRMNLLVSHAETFLNNDKILSEAIKVDIGSELGSIYFHLGNYLKAKQILEINLVSLNKFNVKDYTRIAQVLLYLGSVYRELGNHEKSTELLKQSFLIYRKYHPDNHAKIAQSLCYLGNEYRSLGNYEKAKELLEESLVIYKKYSPDNHSKIAQSLLYLGNVARNLGNYTNAKDLLEESLVIYRKYYPDNHSKIAHILMYLGIIYSELAHYRKAKDLLKQSLLVYKQYLPENYARIAQIQVYLGSFYRNLGDYKKAKSLLEQGLMVYTEHLPENHIKIAWAKVQLAIVYSELKDYEKAKNLLEENLIVYEKFLTKNHVETSWVAVHLANVYRNLGRHEKAKDLLEKSLIVYRKCLASNHTKVIHAKLYLGHVYKELGYYKSP